MTVRVKICGVRDVNELEICARYADAVGFVTEYPVDVPWNISREVAKHLVSMTPPFVYTVVVTSGSVEKILEISEYTKADAIQLHGNEGEKEVKEIAEQIDAKVIKALQIDVKTGKIDGKDAVRVARSYSKHADAIVLDSKTEKMPAGTGVPFNWEIAMKVRESISIPLILAGGLNSSNVRQAIEIINPFAVDVISGIERNGRKDERKIKEFMRAAKVIK